MILAMDAGKRNISSYFNGQRKLEIPFFQRSYVWEEDLLRRFLESMELVSKNRKEYFLGSIIAKQKQTGTSSKGDVHYIVDGQQRLTTLALFLKILLHREGKENTFKRIFTMVDDEGELCLSHNYFDRECFENIMRQTDLTPVKAESRLARAYNYFLERVFPDVYDSKAIREALAFVGIDLSADEDEQVIFDTINSLGVNLTTGELLKNYVFSKDSVGEYLKFWKPVFEGDAETLKYWNSEITEGRLRRNTLENFLYAYLHIKINDPSLGISAIDKLRFRTAENLFSQYKDYLSMSGIGHVEFVNDLAAYAKLYREYISPSILDEELSGEWGIDRINVIMFGLDATSIIPYVLYVLKNQEDEEARNDIFMVLEAYVLRRVVCRSSNENYSDLFSLNLISNRVLTASEFVDYIMSRQAGSSLAVPADSALKEGFLKSILVNQRAKSVLYLLESLARDDNYATALKGLNSYSLEHLMPKKWKPEAWPLTDGITVEERDRILKTLGNLAILPAKLNSAVSNKAWAVKKAGTKIRHGLKHYAEGLVTLKHPLALEQWTESDIDQRSRWLYALARKYWQFSPELCDDDNAGCGAAGAGQMSEHQHDSTKYSLNGSQPLNKRDFAFNVVSLFLKEHPGYTFVQLKNEFPAKMMNKYKGQGLLASVAELVNSGKNARELAVRYNYGKEGRKLTSADGVDFYVTTQWTYASIQNMVDFAVAQGWAAEAVEEESESSKGGKGALRVEYDGMLFKYSTSAMTFARTIREIGAERVAGIGIACNKYPLVGRERPGKYSCRRIAGGWYVMTNNSTAKKVDYLQLIASALGISMVISVDE